MLFYLHGKSQNKRPTHFVFYMTGSDLGCVESIGRRTHLNAGGYLVKVSTGLTLRSHLDPNISFSVMDLFRCHSKYFRRSCFWTITSYLWTQIIHIELPIIGIYFLGIRNRKQYAQTLLCFSFLAPISLAPALIVRRDVTSSATRSAPAARKKNEIKMFDYMFATCFSK